MSLGFVVWLVALGRFTLDFRFLVGGFERLVCFVGDLGVLAIVVWCSLACLLIFCWWICWV